MARIYKPGEIIGRYQIEDLVNTGNYALCYRAVEVNSGNKVFFKQYSDPTDFYPEEFKKFVAAQRRMAELLSQVDEAEIILETFENDGVHFQAKEWMIGQDLRDHLVKSEPTFNERCQIAAVCVWGLKKLHEKNIVHNDLKPEQIFLWKDPGLAMKYKVKITDFDFSSIDGEHEPIYKVTTPFYTSPEHFREQKTTSFSDVFTMGVILYEILCADHPYMAKDEDDYKEKAFKHDARKAAEMSGAVSSELSEALYQSLNPDASKRPRLEDIHQVILKQKKPPVAARVELISKDSEIRPSVHKTSVVGREFLRVFPDYKYVSKDQFELIKTDEGWRIRGIQGVVNDSFLDGEKITGIEKNLVDGAEILVGNKEARTGLILTARLVFGK